MGSRAQQCPKEARPRARMNQSPTCAGGCDIRHHPAREDVGGTREQGLDARVFPVRGG